MEESQTRKISLPSKFKDYILDMSSLQYDEEVDSEEENWEENDETSEYEESDVSSEDVNIFS